MKHAAISQDVSRQFDLPFAWLYGEQLTFELPAESLNWHRLPDRFLEGIELLAKFAGKVKDLPGGQFADRRQVQEGEYIFFVHVRGAKALATDNATLIEFDLGSSAHLDFSLNAKHIRALKAFGTSPESCGDTSHFGIAFKWPSGNIVTLKNRHRFQKPRTDYLDQWGWDNFHAVSDHWRNQIIGHFSFRPTAGETGILHITPSGFSSGLLDNDPAQKLSVPTHCQVNLQFQKKRFLDVIKVASEIKFVHEDDRDLLLFKGERIRGVATALNWRARRES